jgi:hypothetical protein
MIANGKMRVVVRMAVERSGGGVMQLGEIDSKSGKKVLEVLKDKHPEMVVSDLMDPDWLSF